MKSSPARRVAAEFVGTLFLVATVVGSGIMGERLADGNVAIALLANTIATGAALIALILTFGPISGAHLNPVVTLTDAMERGIAWKETPPYIFAQVLGGISGAVIAHLMFGLPAVSLSRHARSGSAQLFSEFVATFGLLAVIWGCSRLRSSATAFAVGAYITAAYWFTASTSFANPAGDHRAIAERYFFGDTACGRAGVYRRANCRSNRRDASLSLADSGAAVGRV